MYEFHLAVSFPDRLEDVAEFESPNGGIIEERSEDEVGSRRDNNDSVFCGVETAGEDIACSTMRRCRMEEWKTDLPNHFPGSPPFPFCHLALALQRRALQTTVFVNLPEARDHLVGP